MSHRDFLYHSQIAWLKTGYFYNINLWDLEGCESSRNFRQLLQDYLDLRIKKVLLFHQEISCLPFIELPVRVFSEHFSSLGIDAEILSQTGHFLSKVIVVSAFAN